MWTNNRLPQAVWSVSTLFAIEKQTTFVALRVNYCDNELNGMFDALSWALNRVWDVLSGVAEMAWDVLTGAAKMAWDVLSGVTKTAWDVLSGVANLCGMFWQWCQKMAWDVLSRDVLSYIQYQRDFIFRDTGLQYQCTLCCNGVIFDAYTDSNSADGRLIVSHTWGDSRQSDSRQLFISADRQQVARLLAIISLAPYFYSVRV